MKSSRRSPYANVMALLLALILLAGLLVLMTPILQIPESAFIPGIGILPMRQLAGAGAIGLLLLSLMGYWVRRYLRDRLARRQARKEAEIQPEALALAYRHKLMAQLSQLKVMDVAAPFDLATSYIPLRVRERSGLYERDEMPPLAGDEIMYPQEALVRFHRLALLGEPGAGKTTLLRYLAWQAAQGRLPDLPDFPILISLNRFAAASRLGASTEPGGRVPRAEHSAELTPKPADEVPGQESEVLQAGPQAASQAPGTASLKKPHDLLDFVVREIDALHRSPTLRSYLEERLEEGSVLLLLDGLDETCVGSSEEARATYRHVVGQINVLTTRYPKVPVVVTSRQAGWKGLLAASFHTLEILKLEQDEVQHFIESWFGLGSSSRSRRGPGQAQELQRVILQNPQVRVWVTNPLLLSLTAFVFEQDGELPEGQAELYRRGMELLLEKWETHRGRKRISRFTAEYQRGLLEEVALHFHLRRFSCFPADDLSGIIASYCAVVGLPADWVPTILERISAQYGLLREQARWYSFPHLTWQEYFAALAISKKGRLELVLEGIPDPWWEGTTLFLAGILEDATPLLEGILSHKDDVFRSHLLLAGRCLARQPRLKRVGLQRNIIEQLQELVEGAYHLPLRRWAIGVLTEIGGPSIAAYFQSLVTAPPRQGRTEEEYRTVHRWIIAALASLGDESTVTKLMALLPNRGIDLAVRTNVAAALGSLGDESVIPQLLTLLPDEEVDYRVRMAVAEALGALGTCPEPCPQPCPEPRWSRRNKALIPPLLHLLPEEKIDYRVRVRMAEILGALGTCPESRNVASQLLRLLSNEKVDYNVRIAVAEALGSLGDPSIAPRLLAILSRQKIDPDVRATIAAALGHLGDKSVIPPLLRLLPNEKIDPSIRWKIVDALSALGAMEDEATVPELLDLLTDEKIDSSVRVSVAEAIGEKTVTPRLPTPIPVGREAAEAMRSLGDRSKVPKLLALLADRELDRSVRLKIVEALGVLGDDRATVEGLAALLDDAEIGSNVYQALFQVSQRIGVRIFARNGGGYEIR